MMMYAATVWWQRAGVAMVRADLGHLQRLACVNNTGSVSTAPTDALEVLLGLPLLRLVVEAEARASAWRLSGVYVVGQRTGHWAWLVQNLANGLLQLGLIFQRGLNKMIPRTALETPFKAEILACKHCSYS
jgi:hypothetical protein